LALGALLAPALKARPLLVTVTVVDYPDHLLPPTAVERAAREQSAPLFERAADQVAPLELETRTLVGDSAGHALHQLAESEDAILITVGSAHHGVFRRVLLGSVGEALLSGTPCAVAVAPAGYAARRPRPDLLIVGSRCYGPLRRALLGGVSTKLMRSATAPVLVVPREGGADRLRTQ
jgi:nucleotide-binding universal stress UspA family protein